MKPMPRWLHGWRRWVVVGFVLLLPSLGLAHERYIPHELYIPLQRDFFRRLDPNMLGTTFPWLRSRHLSLAENTVTAIGRDKSRVHVDEMQRTLERVGLHPISIRIVLQRPGSKRRDRQVVAECWTRAGALDEHNCTAEDYCEV